MGRAPCCEKVGLKRGRWTDEEDGKLRKYIQENGEGSWRSLPKNAGLLRCGKSCRLRWINYLRTDLKRGSISAQEEEIIINLHASMGNRWSLIAAHLPGRTDNEIKNYWNSHLSRKIDSYRRPNPSFIPPPPKAAGGRKKKIKSKSSMEESAKATVLMPATPTPERETIGRLVMSKSSQPSGDEGGEREGEMLQGGGGVVCEVDGITNNSSSIMEDLSGLWGPGLLEEELELELDGETGSSQTHEDTFSWFWEEKWSWEDQGMDDAMLSWLLSSSHA